MANVYVLVVLLDFVLLPLIAIVTIQQIKALHLYDCLRANKSTSAWGVEARVPFLDKEFIKIAMDIDPEWKMVLHSLNIFFHTLIPNFILRSCIVVIGALLTFGIVAAHYKKVRIGMSCYGSMKYEMIYYLGTFCLLLKDIQLFSPHPLVEVIFLIHRNTFTC